MLSKVDIFDIRNNISLSENLPRIVVNCSQRLISLIFGTTCFCFHCSIICCELLSKVDIFDIRNNRKWQSATVETLWIALKGWYLWYSEQLCCHNVGSFWVVNCSQRLISLIFGTTWQQNGIRENTLWIALKGWYLWYSEQQTQ